MISMQREDTCEANGTDYEDQIALAITSMNCRVKAPTSCMVVYVVSSCWLLSAGA
jgi:hypothetical protein